jgi:hypothetical protein
VTWVPTKGLRADAPLALLLAGLAGTLAVAWPDRPLDANGSWYAVAVARHAGLLLLAAASALSAGRASSARRREDLVAVTLAWALSMPFEVLAWHGSAPEASLAWSLLIAGPAALSAYGVTALVAGVARRLRLAWALPLLVPLVALGLGLLDVRTGPVLALPWLLPFVPSWIALGVLGAGAAATLAFLVRPGRRPEVRA